MIENINTKANRYLELDALRGVAALMVVFFHYTMDRPEAELGFKFGTTGVDLFFIISGFVIFMSLNHVSNGTDFVINRVSRLYPTYWTSVTFTFILICLYSVWKDQRSDISVIQYLGNMTMFQFYLKMKNLDGPYWTMIIEMIFYMGMLFLFQVKGMRWLNWVGITTCILLIVVSQFFGTAYIVGRTLFLIPLLPFVPLFFAGTVFYKIYTDKTKLPEMYAILILCYVTQVLLFEFAGRSHITITQGQYAIMVALYFTLFTLFVNHKLGFIVSKTTLFLGKISFALYLTHQYVSTKILIPVLTENLRLNFWVAAIFITLPVAILIASFISYYVEAPLGKWMKAKLHAINKNRYSRTGQA